MNKVKLPYNINAPAQELALKALEEVGQVNNMITEIVDMRNAMQEVLRQIPIVEKVFSSETNFLLVKIKDAEKAYKYLLAKNILVFDCSDLPLCENCLRITIGTEKENTLLIDTLADFLQENFK